MEFIINVAVFTFVFLLIFFVEKINSRKEPSEEEVANFQKELNERSKKLKEKYGFYWMYNALEEIKKERRMKKGFYFVFSGIALAFIFVSLMFTIGDNMSFSTIGTFILSSLYLIIYGLYSMSSSKKLAVKMFLLVFVLGIIFMSFLEKLLLYFIG